MLVVLDPDVARLFPTGEAVNETLRAVAQIVHIHQRRRHRANKRMSKRKPKNTSFILTFAFAATGISLGRIQMSIAAELLQQHIQTLVDDHQQWQTLIADNILWELACTRHRPSGQSRVAMRCFIM